MFDQLPVELLYSIFSYLTTFDVLYSFHNLTDYLTATIANYGLYLSFNFRTVTREQFYFLCHRVYPESVISLTVIGDDNSQMTETKLNLLFSQLHMEHFTHLQSLTLIRLNHETKDAQQVLPSLLSLFAINRPNYKANLPVQLISQNVETLQILRLDRAVVLRDVHTFPAYLRHLTFDKSTNISDLEFVLQSLTPDSLSHLDVKLEGMCSTDRLLSMLERHSVSLTNLALKIEDSKCVAKFNKCLFP
jgi:hypothetical protein